MQINKFLEKKDYDLISFKILKAEMEKVYVEILKGAPSTYGTGKVVSKIHWSRDWEYPWAIICSEVKAGETVLDCGCGGSPLLPVLAKWGCECYGADPNVFMNCFIVQHWKNSWEQIKRKHREMDQNNLSFFQRAKTMASLLYHSPRRPSNLWGFKCDPNKKLGTSINYTKDSMDKLSYPKEYFDKVYCISVIEHLSEEIAYAGVKEMARVLKKGGKLIITMDVEGSHVNPAFVHNFQKIIKESGLRVCGEKNFRKPAKEEMPYNCPYLVVGFILEK